MSAYHRYHGLDAKIVRIFNTYGPRMRLHDGRAVPAFMSQALPYLDALEYVQQYAWFGTFRNDDANKWTGDGVSLLDGHGRLTALGAEYMGGEQGGFEEGMGGGAAGVRFSLSLVVVVSLIVGLLGRIL